MVSYGKDFEVTSDSTGNPGYIRPLETNLDILTRILGVCTAIAGLLAALSLLHIIISLLSGRKLNRSGIDSMGESLLNTRPEIYDRFEEVLVTDVLDDVVIGGTTGRLGDSDGEM
ncbi:hypothetical protein PV328_007261 [Microctonus aethiopoides]|uniref:Uncharacterized protein n=1 Tax=Microctonus aethiopoides TaxID=144406 RepID=A0AA39FQV8_9HYME|nr:hypothetical protein PV328_007261 [Microctonus aethiopoides]